MMIKLKHTLLFGLLCMVCMSVFAQNQNQNQSEEERIVSFMPYEADQHLILDELANPQVASWKITIYKKELNNAGESVLRSRETMDLTDTYYMRIPDRYNNEDHFVGVQGMSTSGTILVEKEPFPPVGPGHVNWEATCYWRCIGKTYAYQLTLLVKEGGGASKVSLAPIPDGVHRYQYMSQTQFNAIGSSPDEADFIEYYGINGDNWAWNAPGVGDQIIRLAGIMPEDNLRNATGDVLTGVVYGVRKHLGDWTYATSPELTGGESNCNQNINWAIGKANISDDLDGYPTLKCVGIAYNGEDDVDGTESGGLGSEEALKEIDCFFDAIIDGEIDDSLYQAWLDCMGLGNGGGGIVIDDIFAESVRSITFQPFNGEEDDIYVLTNEDFVNQNGELIIPEVNIPEGLNMVKFQLDRGRHHTLFYTANNATSTQGNNTTAQSDALDVTIYEVPITRNKFTMTMSVQADRTFSYELYNLSGHLLFQKEYTLQAGQTIQDEIRPANGLPRGVLINRFRFTDGSEVIEQTVKI